MRELQQIHELAYHAVDLLNNLNDEITPDYKTGYAFAVLDAILVLSRPAEQEGR